MLTDQLLEHLNQLPEVLIRQLINAIQWIQNSSGSLSQPKNLPIIANEKGETIAVVVPIELWKKLALFDETDYLLSSETMKQRLLEARQRYQGISWEEAREKLRI
ncbi:MAG: hypothetical protein ACO31I_14595 [Prochlorotrichaceae cyanobacterium]|jgi:PHD/YefM family antitoxin component YafN of YafNO toxin-antitoxin module